MNQCDIDRIRPGDFVSFQFPYRNGESYYTSCPNLRSAAATTALTRVGIGVGVMSRRHYFIVVLTVLLFRVRNC